MKPLLFSLLLICPISFSYAQVKGPVTGQMQPDPYTSSLLEKSIDPDSLYFPVKLFENKKTVAALKDFRNKWYSSQLKAMNEPILKSLTSPAEVYRFTWLRSFHNPVAVRMERKGEDLKVFWKLCSGAGGYDPGRMIIDREKKIDRKQWDQFMDLLSAMDFRGMKSVDENQTGLDGAQWILEGIQDGNYHVVDRWSPGRKSRFARCCEFLLSLTDLEIAEQDKY